MPVTITFKTIKEEKPKHHQDIIYLMSISSFGLEGFRPSECCVEYIWLEIDEKGDETGMATCYNGEALLEDHKLQILFDGYAATDSWLWCDQSTFWECFD